MCSRHGDRRGLVIALGLLAASGALAGSWPWETGENTPRLVEAVPEPAHRLELGFVPSSRVEGYGKTAVIELNADWDFAYLWDILYGDIQMGLDLRSFVLTDSARVWLPDQLVELSLDAQWQSRVRDDFAVRLGATPGIYSDLEELGSEMFSCPFSVALLKGFHPDVTGLLGLEIRPDFERELMPLIGIQWRISDDVRLHAQIPESRLLWFAGSGVTLHCGFDWRSVTFALREKRPLNADQFTIEDFAFFGGLTCQVTDEIHLTGEIGQCFDRSLEYGDTDDDTLDRELDLEDRWFLRIGLGGPF